MGLLINCNSPWYVQLYQGEFFKVCYTAVDSFIVLFNILTEYHQWKLHRTQGHCFHQSNILLLTVGC